MAQTIGTNVVVDLQAEYELLSKILEFLEQKYLQKDETKRSKLFKQLYADLRIGKGKPIFQSVDSKYYNQIVQQLEEHNIPFTTIGTAYGTPLILFGSNHLSDWSEILQNTLRFDPNMQKTITIEELCKAADFREEKNILEIRCVNDADFIIAQDQIHHEGTGIVSAATDFENGEGRIYLSMDDCYQENSFDFLSFELKYAFSRLDQDLYHLKQDQILYDHNEYDLILDELARSDGDINIVLGDTMRPVNSLSNHIEFEENDKHQIEAILYDSKQNELARSVLLPDMGRDGADREANKRVLINMASNIYNKRAMSRSEWNRIKTKTYEDRKEEIYGKDNSKNQYECFVDHEHDHKNRTSLYDNETGFRPDYRHATLFKEGLDPKISESLQLTKEHEVLYRLMNGKVKGFENVNVLEALKQQAILRAKGKAGNRFERMDSYQKMSACHAELKLLTSEQDNTGFLRNLLTDLMKQYNETNPSIPFSAVTVDAVIQGVNKQINESLETEKGDKAEYKTSERPTEKVLSEQYQRERNKSREKEREKNRKKQNEKENERDNDREREF